MKKKTFKHHFVSIISELTCVQIAWRRNFVFFVFLGIQFCDFPEVFAKEQESVASPKEEVAPARDGKESDPGVKLEGLRIRAHFDSALFSARTESSKQSQLSTFCKSWGDALSMQKGPWGFGIATEVTCAMKEGPHIDLTPEMKLFDVWNLIVQKSELDGQEVIEASICRLKEESKATHFDPLASEVKCEAKRVFPWSDFKVRFVRHRAFVRLVVASLYDQLPFLSVVSKNIVRFDKLRIEGFKEPDTFEVSFPPAPTDVVFADVSFDPYERRFGLRIIPENDAIYKAMTQAGRAWVVHKEGRAARFDEFSQRIETAYLALTTIFQLDRMRFEKNKAKALAEKLKNRNYFDLVIRGEGAAGLPLLVLDSSFGGALGGYVRVNNVYGGGVRATYEKLNFTLGTVVREKESAGSSTNATKVKLTETSFWAYGTVTPRFNLGILEPLNLSLGPRLGLVQSVGSLQSGSSLPDSDVGIKNQELGIGIITLFGWTFADTYELNLLASYDIGATIKSATLRTGGEVSWILSRLVTEGRKERPPSLKVGLGLQFASLSREFSSTELGRSFNTKVTLNGLQSSVFLEQTL